MLNWSITFLIIAIIAAIFGFTTIAGASIAVARFLFFVFIVLFLIFLVLGRSSAPRI